MRRFFELGIFGGEEMDRSFYDVKIKDRLTAIENDIIIFCQPRQKKTSAVRAVATLI